MITLIKRTHKDEYEEEICYYVPKEYEYQRNGERIQRKDSGRGAFNLILFQRGI